MFGTNHQRNEMNNGLLSLIRATNVLEEANSYTTEQQQDPSASVGFLPTTKEDDSSIPKRKVQKIKRNLVRELTPAEIARTMAKAKAKGLPDGWTFEFDRKRGLKKWIPPDGGRKCDSIPQALRMSVRLGLIPADRLSDRGEEKVASSEDGDEDEERNIPTNNGWSAEQQQWFGSTVG